jgi:hypothetical protein
LFAVIPQADEERFRRMKRRMHKRREALSHEEMEYNNMEDMEGN